MQVEMQIMKLFLISIDLISSLCVWPVGDIEMISDLFEWEQIWSMGRWQKMKLVPERLIGRTCICIVPSFHLMCTLAQWWLALSLHHHHGPSPYHHNNTISFKEVYRKIIHRILMSLHWAPSSSKKYVSKSERTMNFGWETHFVHTTWTRPYIYNEQPGNFVILNYTASF